MKNININKRVDFLDYLRGVSAVIVFFSHSFEYFIQGWRQIAKTQINFGMIGVLAFFMVSGFIIPLSLERKKNIKLFLINRFFRIYPLYLFLICFNIVWCFFFEKEVWLDIIDNPLKYIVTHLFFIQTFLIEKLNLKKDLVEASWTLALEWIWYLFFCFLFILGINKNSKILTFISIMCVLSCCIYTYVCQTVLPMGIISDIFLIMIWGVFYNRFYFGELTRKTFIFISLVYLILIFIALNLGFNVSFGNKPFTFNTVLISWTLGICLFNIFFFLDWSKRNIISNILQYLGKISYSFYLIHHIFLDICKFQLFLDGWQGIVLSLMMTLLCSHFSHKYIENTAISYSHKLIK